MLLTADRPRGDVGVTAGILLGALQPTLAADLKPLGDAFIKLIKMIIPVLVFCVVVHGIAGAGDLKRVGRVGVKALIYFEVVTTIALMLGLALAFWFQPGVGMNVDPKALDAKAMSAYAETVKAGEVIGEMALIQHAPRLATARARLGLAKAHWLDAACVGSSTPDTLDVGGVHPLRISATGHGSRASRSTPSSCRWAT